MNQILHCDWLPDGVRWSYLACSGLPTASRRKNFPKAIYHYTTTKLVWSSWLDIARLWTSTPSRSINMPKENWPHTWWITMHISVMLKIGVLFAINQWKACIFLRSLSQTDCLFPAIRAVTQTVNWELEYEAFRIGVIVTHFSPLRSFQFLHWPSKT